MLATKPESRPFAFTLAPRQSVRILEQATRSAAVVTLTPRRDTQRQLVGPIDRATPESLWIRLPDVDVEVGASLLSVYCDGTLELGDARYLFDTNILGASGADECTQLEIVRPDALRVIQRRRFWRAELRHSAPVRLIGGGEQGNADSGWSCEAVLMNMSVEGLACRADQASADLVSVGEGLQVQFILAPHEEPFCFDGVVKSKIPAGTKGRTILGLQFMHNDQDDQYKRLQGALEQFT